MRESPVRRLTRRAASAGRIALLCTVPDVAHAHPGRALAPHDLWRAWTVAPFVIAGCLLATWLYASGRRALRRRSRHARSAASWRAVCFALGIAAVLAALVSPLDAAGNVLFAAHMVQHLLLLMVAAPLLVLGDPMMVSLWAFPVGTRRAVGAWWKHRAGIRRAWRALSTPAVAWTLHVLVLWAWHLPRLYDAAVADGALHVLEHASFFLTALLFWWVLLRPHGRRLGAPAAILYLFGAGLQSTLLGALLALAREPLYQAHLATTGPWGLTPLEDQQLAGLLMWVPAGLIYLAALVPLAWRALREPPRQGARVLAMAGVSTRGTP